MVFEVILQENNSIFFNPSIKVTFQQRNIDSIYSLDILNIPLCISTDQLYVK